MKHDKIVISKDGKIGKNEDSLIKMIMSAAGRTALAQSMVAPIRRALNYTGIARKCLVVSPLPQGALPVYDKDPDVSSIVYATKPNSGYKHDTIVISDKGKIGRQGFGSRVKIPVFEVVSNPTIHIGDVKRRRFDLIDRCSSEDIATTYKHDTVVISKNGKISLKKNLPSYGLMSRAAQKAREEIMAQEDANIFAALDAAADVEYKNK